MLGRRYEYLVEWTLTMQFVALGADVQLTATIPKRVSDYKSANLSLRLDHGVTTETLVNTQVRLSSGTGTHTWTATGLLDKELSAIVDVTWTGRGMLSGKTVTQQLFVYRTQVELYAIDSASTPIPNAAYELTYTPHSEYTGPAAQVQTTGRTNGSGKATISNLPPLQSLEVRWKNPNLLSDTGWINSGDFTEDGAKRKAMLRAGYRAQLVNVTAGTSLTRYVNIPLDISDTAGPLVSIRAKVHNSDGGGSQGDKIWARVTWAGTNCARTDKTPKLQGSCLVEAANRQETKVVVHKQLGSDNGEVVFDLDCGVAGGDKFSLWVGGDPEAEDDGPVEIVTKRKLKLIPHFPPDYPFADCLFTSSFKQKLIRALAAAEIELEIAAAETITYKEKQELLPGYPPPKQISAEVSERIGWQREFHYIYTHDCLFNPLEDSFRAVADYPTIRAFYADGSLTVSNQGQPFRVDGLTSRTSDWITSGDGRAGFLACDLDGNSMLTVFQRSEPERNIYEYVYLFDEDAKEFVVDNKRDEIETHEWAVERQRSTATCPWSSKSYPAYKGKLVLKGQATKMERKAIPLNSQGLPQGFVYNGPGYGEQTLVRTIPPVPEKWGEWRTADGKSGKITMDHIEIDMETDKWMRFRFKLPEEAEPSSSNPASASIGLRTVTGGVAGESNGCAIILLQREGEPTDKAAYALLHEIGHSLGQSWSDNSSPPPGVALDRKYLYGTALPSPGTNRGHRGPHCAYGLPDDYLVNTQDYSKLLQEKGLHGTCVMFGGVGPKTVYTDESRKFCPKCLPTIKSQDLSKVNGSQG